MCCRSCPRIASPVTDPTRRRARRGCGSTSARRRRGSSRAATRAVVPGDVKDSELIAASFASDPDERMPPAQSQEDAQGIGEGAAQALDRGRGASINGTGRSSAPKRPALPAVHEHRLGAQSDRPLRAGPHGEGGTAAVARSGSLHPGPPCDARPDRVAADHRRRWIASSTTSAPTPTRSTSIEVLTVARLRRALGARSGSTWPATPTPTATRPTICRTIWKYRDWVIDAHQREHAVRPVHDRADRRRHVAEARREEQILATAFHRNTLTNDEGGTSDEEFRVRGRRRSRQHDACRCGWASRWRAPSATITSTTRSRQEEYFRVFAIFNQTEDADKQRQQPAAARRSRPRSRSRRRSSKPRSPRWRRNC